MNRLFTRKELLTVPNLLSLLRLFLIPLILWLHYGKGDTAAAAAVIFLSGLTDVADGMIARRWNMVSDLGKILDPVADKLTQLALICCFISEYSWMLPLLMIFISKELIMAAAGYMAIKKKDSVNSAQWFGKLNTMTIYAVMIILFIFPGIGESTANALIILCAFTSILALIKYLLFYRELFRDGIRHSH